MESRLMLAVRNVTYAASPKLPLGTPTNDGFELMRSPSLLTGRARKPVTAVPSFAGSPRRYFNRSSPRGVGESGSTVPGTRLSAAARLALIVLALYAPAAGTGVPGTGHRKATPFLVVSL